MTVLKADYVHMMLLLPLLKSLNCNFIREEKNCCCPFAWCKFFGEKGEKAVKAVKHENFANGPF